MKHGDWVKIKDPRSLTGIIYDVNADNSYATVEWLVPWDNRIQRSGRFMIAVNYLTSTIPTDDEKAFYLGFKIEQ